MTDEQTDAALRALKDWIEVCTKDGMDYGRGDFLAGFAAALRWAKAEDADEAVRPIASLMRLQGITFLDCIE